MHAAWPAATLRLALLGSCFVASFAGCERRAPQPTTPQVTKAQQPQAPATDAEAIVASLMLLRPWPDDGAFARSDWEEYIRVAKEFQAASPEIADKALEDFADRCMDTGSPTREVSRGLLLMRVMFDLPETGPSGGGPAGWRRTGFENAGRGWPVTWADGSPKLVCGFQGYFGRPYRPADEFRSFRTKVKYREPL